MNEEFENAIEHLRSWPKAYRMGSHDSRIVQVILEEIERLRQEIACLRDALGLTARSPLPGQR